MQTLYFRKKPNLRNYNLYFILYCKKNNYYSQQVEEIYLILCFALTYLTLLSNSSSWQPPLKCRQFNCKTLEATPRFLAVWQKSSTYIWNFKFSSNLNFFFLKSEEWTMQQQQSRVVTLGWFFTIFPTVLSPSPSYILPKATRRLKILKINFGKSVIPYKYTFIRPLLVPFICFGFKNNENSNAILCAMQINYSKPSLSFGKGK